MGNEWRLFLLVVGVAVLFIRSIKGIVQNKYEQDGKHQMHQRYVSKSVPRR